MTTLLYILAFGLVAYVIIRIVINSLSGIRYSPNNEESKIKINEVKTGLKEKWDIEPGNFWIPLDGVISNNICYFNSDEFNKNFGLLRFSELMNRIEKGNIYSFAESNVFSQFDSLKIENYPGLDTYYTNSSADWVIYINHENTITFGGSLIIDALKSEWSDLGKFINPYENNTDNSTHAPAQDLSSEQR